MTPSDVKFEIGHVLFIDIVGYSKLLINEQSEQMQKLKEIVRGTEQFRIAVAEGKLLRLPTGDGGERAFSAGAKRRIGIRGRCPRLEAEDCAVRAERMRSMAADSAALAGF